MVQADRKSCGSFQYRGEDAVQVFLLCMKECERERTGGIQQAEGLPHLRQAACQAERQGGHGHVQPKHRCILWSDTQKDEQLRKFAEQALLPRRAK